MLVSPCKHAIPMGILVNKEDEEDAEDEDDNKEHAVPFSGTSLKAVTMTKFLWNMEYFGTIKNFFLFLCV